MSLFRNTLKGIIVILKSGNEDISRDLHESLVGNVESIDSCMTSHVLNTISIYENQEV